MSLALAVFQDKKSVESVCLCFARLVDNYSQNEKILKELAAHEMLANVLKLVSQPAPNSLSRNIFVDYTFLYSCSF